MSTLTKLLTRIGLSALVMAAAVSGADAKTVVVGPATCNPGPQHFTTIQAAIDNVALSAPGSTVLVCPGTYPEQVVVSTPLVLQGIVSGTAGAPVITVPAGGLVPNVTTPLYGLVAAHLTVQNTTNVIVKRLTIDGASAACPTGANRVVGIEVSGVGDATWTGSAGTVDSNVVRRVNGCDLAEGIDSENSSVTITANELHDIGRNCIVHTGLIANITNNRIQNCHMAGIQMNSAGATSLISGNTVYAPRGVEVNQTSGIKITSNIVGPFTGIGILTVESSNNQISSNQVNADYTGVYMFKGAGTNIISNSISYSTYGIVNDTPQSAGTNVNSLQSNTINEATIGMVQYNTDGSGDSMNGNNFYNCVTTTSPTF